MLLVRIKSYTHPFLKQLDAFKRAESGLENFVLNDLKIIIKYLRTCLRRFDIQFVFYNKNH